MAAMLEEQKNLINRYCIWSLFSSNMAAESLSLKYQGIDCKPRIINNLMKFYQLLTVFRFCSIRSKGNHFIFDLTIFLKH